MSEISVRMSWASNLTDDARATLRQLSDANKVIVSGKANGPIEDGTLNVNKRTALTLVGWGYAELDGEDSIAITREGEIKVGNVTLTRAERRRRKEALTLRAQATGRWKPAPAGASAAASRKDRESRTDYAYAREEVSLAQSELSGALEMLELAREWGDSVDLKHERKEVERCRARVEEAQREFDRIKGTKAA